MTRQAELLARIRAARAYADRTVDQLAHAAGISEKTMRRILTGDREARAHEIEAFADCCGVPRVFFAEGFAPLLAIEIERTEQRLRQLKSEADQFGHD